METCKMQPLKKSICPARRVLNLLKGKFTLEILSEIIDGNTHYGSLLRSVEGIRLNLHNLLLIFFYKIENVILKDLVILLIKAT